MRGAAARAGVGGAATWPAVATPAPVHWLELWTGARVACVVRDALGTCRRCACWMFTVLGYTGLMEAYGEAEECERRDGLGSPLEGMHALDPPPPDVLLALLARNKALEGKLLSHHYETVSNKSAYYREFKKQVTYVNAILTLLLLDPKIYWKKIP